MVCSRSSKRWHTAIVITLVDTFFSAVQIVFTLSPSPVVRLPSLSSPLIVIRLVDITFRFVANFILTHFDVSLSTVVIVAVSHNTASIVVFLAITAVAIIFVINTVVFIFISMFWF